MFDRPSFAEVVELVLELGSAVTVYDDWRAVSRDERVDEVGDLFRCRVFSAFEDEWEA